MDDHQLHLRPLKEDLLIGYLCIAGVIGAIWMLGSQVWGLPEIILPLCLGFGVWAHLRTVRYAYENRLGLRYLNILHGARWTWREGHEGLTKYLNSRDGIKAKYSVDKRNEKLNLQDVEAYCLSHFIDRLRQGGESIDITALSEMQRSDIAFDFQVLGTEYQRQAEKIKRITEDSALATRYQHIALYCQKEARRMEQGGEVSSVSIIAPQGQVEELKSIGGSVRLMQQEGRVTELRFYGLPPGEYTLTMKRQTKVIKIDDDATSVSLADLGVSPQPHGAFMVNGPDGASDAVRW